MNVSKIIQRGDRSERDQCDRLNPKRLPPYRPKGTITGWRIQRLPAWAAYSLREACVPHDFYEGELSDHHRQVLGAVWYLLGCVKRNYVTVEYNGKSKPTFKIKHLPAVWEKHWQRYLEILQEE
jgi:hypothetical protein